jgi:hypothetical protein
MALKNDEVLARLQEQLVQTNEELTVLSNTRLKLMGAIDVLMQIENSKVQEEQSEEQEENVGEGEE